MKLQIGNSHIYKMPCYAVIQSPQFSTLKRFQTLKLLWKFSFSIICFVTASLKTWVVGPTANFTNVNIYFTAYSFCYMLFCYCCCCCCWVSKSCLTLWYHMKIAHQVSLFMGFPAKNTGKFPLQGIFPTQGSNRHLLLGRWILYHWATWEALSYIYLSFFFWVDNFFF